MFVLGMAREGEIEMGQNASWMAEDYVYPYTIQVKVQGNDIFLKGFHVYICDIEV